MVESSSRPGSRSGSIGGLLSPLAIDENGVALEVEMGSRSYSYSFSELDADGFPPELAGVASPREPTSPTPADPSLKFEFNPFSEALEPERTALPLHVWMAVLLPANFHFLTRVLPVCLHPFGTASALLDEHEERYPDGWPSWDEC